MTTATTMTGTTASPLALSYVLLHVADFAAATAYFTDTLGLVPDDAFDGPGFCQFNPPATGGVPFAIAAATAETAPAGAVELYFYTDDAAAQRTTLTLRGVDASPLIAAPFGTFFEVPSSDGAPLRIMQQPV